MKTLLHSLVGGCFFYATLVRGLVPAIAKPENASLLRIPTNSSRFSVQLPPPRPGFATSTDWNSAIRLNPFGVCLTAIKLMYGLSEQPWSSAVELVQSNLRVIIQSPGYNVIFFTNDNPPSTQLTTGLTVTALRDVVHSMANRQPGFYEAETHLKIQGHSIGRIWITSIANSPSPISGDVPLSDTNAKTNAPKTYGSSLVKNDLAAGSGKIPDPEDSRFMISYQYEGQTLPELGILTVILDTLADVAQYNSDGPCAYAFGLSSDASIAMHIEPVQGQIMFGWHAARSLNLLVNQLFLVQHRFQEIQFKLFYYGSAVGKGYIMKAGALGGDDDDGLIASN